jgi:DNA-binding CsgD family transcriptional regulator
MSRMNREPQAAEWRCRRLDSAGSRSLPCVDGHHLFCDEAWAGIADRLHLSPRQAQIVKCVLADQSDDEITRSLGISWSTVQTHMRRLHEKLRASSRVQMAMLVFDACREWRTTAPPPTGCRESTRH